MKKEILSEIQSLIDQINTNHKKYGENDIRASFFDGYFQTLRTYYTAYFHLESEDILDKYREIYPAYEIKRENLLLHFQGHKNLLNSFLIINSWSNFELFITLFAEAILFKNDISELLCIDYLRIKKILKRYDLNELTLNKLKKFNKNHLAHSPIINKYGKIFKLIESYPDNRNKHNDIEFLIFLGRLRNCIHSNYIYFGKDLIEYSYSGETFIFNPGHIISSSPQTEISIFRLTQNLSEIVKVLIHNIPHESEIYDPSVELIEK